MQDFKETINGRVYDTQTATLIASDHYWDGSNWDRRGRNNFLYKTKKGNYFKVFTTRWQGERDEIVPISKDEAKEIWDELPEKETDYKTAFDIEPEEA